MGRSKSGALVGATLRGILAGASLSGTGAGITSIPPIDGIGEGIIGPVTGKPY